VLLCTFFRCEETVADRHLYHGRMTVTAGDQLVAHVRQLFKLDEEQQKAALASLSAYADKQNREDLIAHESTSDIPVPSARPGIDSRGAMPLAESCFATCDAPAEPMRVSFGGAQTASQSPTSPMHSTAPAGVPWHNVAQELGNNLPKGVTTILQDLLALAESWDSKTVNQQQLSQPQGNVSKNPDGRIAAVRLLKQQLERDQEASVRKLHNMMGHPCSMNDGVGMNGRSLQVSHDFSVPFTGKPSQDVPHCKALTERFSSGARAAQPEQRFVGSMEHAGLSSGYHVGDTSPPSRSMFFPAVEGRQRLASEVGDMVGQSMEGRFGQHSRRSGMMDQPQTPVSVGAPWHQETLRMHLRSLINVDSGRVLIVRKINRLGFASQAILHEHFSWYGIVERVLVAHSRVKSTCAGGDKGASPVSSRLRPSGLGFIVMSRVEDAQAILAHGSEQPVNGIVVRIQQFQRQVTAQEDDGNEDESETAVPETNPSEENCSSPRNSSSCEESH